MGTNLESIRLISFRLNKQVSKHFNKIKLIKKMNALEEIKTLLIKKMKFKKHLISFHGFNIE